MLISSNDNAHKRVSVRFTKDNVDTAKDRNQSGWWNFLRCEEKHKKMFFIFAIINP